MRPWGTSVPLFLTSFKLRIDIMRTAAAMNKSNVISDEVFDRLVEVYESTLAKHNYENLLALANRDPSASAASFARIRERVVGVCKRRFEPILQNAGVTIDLEACFRLVEFYAKAHTQRMNAVK